MCGWKKEKLERRFKDGDIVKHKIDGKRYIVISEVSFKDYSLLTVNDGQGNGYYYYDKFFSYELEKDKK